MLRAALGMSPRSSGSAWGDPGPVWAEQRVRGREGAGPRGRRGREALGTEPRRGSSGTAAASGDPRDDADSRAGGHGGGPGLGSASGRCLRASWAGGSGSKGHCQRAALTAAAAARPPLTQSGSVTSGCSRMAPDATLALPGAGDSSGLAVPSPCPHPTGAAASWEGECPCATCGDAPRCPR